MPKLKQPVPLEKIALHVLNEFVVHYCDELSDKGSLDDLRRGIFVIKKRVCSYMPWHLLADFTETFVREFCSKTRQVGHTKAALEILMDIEIPGLRCTSPILAHVDPYDVNRFQRLEELDLGCFLTSVPIHLEDFRLTDLTSFTFDKKCTDFHLRVIGRECSKLQVLNVRDSEVTDEGLCALSACSELRVVDIVGCPVSHSGINDLLSVHKKIETFAHWDGSGSLKDYDVLFFLDSSVCQSLGYYLLENDRDISPVHHLENPMDPQSVVDRFPNLMYLKINCMYPEDLSVLKSLDFLTGLEVHFVQGIADSEIAQTWKSLQTLLIFIGANVTTLKLSCFNGGGFSLKQNELNFIFHSCPNIENLAFDHAESYLVVPPFRKLKEFTPNLPLGYHLRPMIVEPVLDFRILENLETLSVLNYRINLQIIEWIMLMGDEFPKLSLIKTNCLKDEEIAEIERIARVHNLDFTVENNPNFH